MVSSPTYTIYSVIAPISALEAKEKTGANGCRRAGKARKLGKMVDAAGSTWTPSNKRQEDGPSAQDDDGSGCRQELVLSSRAEGTRQSTSSL